jgi:hypothetical protein
VFGTLMPCLSARPERRADLNLVTRRNGDREAGGDGVARARRQRQVLGGEHVHSGRAGVA